MTLERAPEPKALADRIAGIPRLAELRAAARSQDARIYLVGGAVRDILLGRERGDLDVAVEGDAGALALSLGAEPHLHDRFGTAALLIDGVELDLAATRTETYSQPGALPQVSPASLAEDLGRRDFTINAMAVPLDAEPELIDPHGGLGDLREGLVRVLHSGSFIDDPTRAVRAVRYAARFALRLEAGTEQLARAADLTTISRDRLEAELVKLALETEAAAGFARLDELGLLALPTGGAELIARLGEIARHPEWSDIAACVPTATLAIALGETDAARKLAALRPAAPSEGVAAADRATDSDLVLARVMGAEWLDDWASQWRHVRLDIGGEELLAAGLPEGPALGAGLKEALRRKLDGEIAGAEQELEAALAAARGD